MAKIKGIIANSVQFIKQIRPTIRTLSIGTIRTRLMIAFVLVVVLAAAAIISITAALGSRDGRQHVINQLQSVVTLKQAEIHSWVNLLNVNLNLVISGEENKNDVRTLDTASPDSPDYEAAYASIQGRFNFISSNLKLFDELFLMDTDGTVRLSTNPAFQNQKHPTENYFTQGMKGSYIEQPSYSLSLETMVVVVSDPIVQNGTTVGVLAGRASLQSLNDIMLERTGLGDTGETYLAGSNYRLLTSLRNENYAAPFVYIHTRGSEAAIDGHENGSSTYVNYSGDRVIGVYRWLPELQVALLAEQQEGEALHTTYMALIIIGAVAAAAVIFAILAARFLTRSITRPLAELAGTAKLIARGDLFQIARVERDDEVGTLARVFNSMTTQLSGLFHAQEQRTIQLRTINEVGRKISSILKVDELLDYVASSLQKTFNYHNVGIILKDPQSGELELKSSAGAYEGGDKMHPVTSLTSPVVGLVGQTGEAQLVNDILNDTTFKLAGSSKHTRAELAVPIKIGDKVTGILDIEADRARAFNGLDLFTAQTLADQLAVAIENARLYEQAQELATLKERTRLARDLHDAVSQTLFSASLIAEVLPRLWERNPEEGRNRLEEIRQLTRGALAEMRTLLLELRPAALTDAELSDLLRQLAESITGRARIPVDLEVRGPGPQPPEVKVALYRIAQEALNNVAKHSGATRAKVSLSGDGNRIELIISDNGKGFDVNSTSPSSLGLGIMQERARGIDAQVTIVSHVGQGTTVTVNWQLKPGEAKP
jgi:signal transduction histidine kinase